MDAVHDEVLGALLFCVSGAVAAATAGQTGSFLNMAPEVVLGEQYNESAVSFHP